MTQLSPRQLQTLALIAEGCTDRDIAQRLHVALPTTRQHVQDIRAKLDARNRAHAVAIGYQTGVLTLEDA